MAYPASLDSLSTSRADSTLMATTHAADHNAVNDALMRTQAELGLDPSGSASTVRARLDSIQPVSPSVYTISNHTVLRALNEGSYVMDDLAHLLGTLVTDLKARGIIG